jgi:hypothetical protein
MARGFAVAPGIPAAGHITTGGHWHSGALDNCTKCETIISKATPPRGANLMSDTIKDEQPTLVDPERCANEHPSGDLDGTRISVPCGAVATRRPIMDDAHSAHLRATGDASEEVQPQPLPMCEDCYQQLLKDIAAQAPDDAFRVWISAEPRTLVIGYTKMTRDRTYIAAFDGYRPGAAQHVLSVTVNLPPGMEPHRVADLVFIGTNAPELDPRSPAGLVLAAIQATGYRGAEAHWSLSVGDTVTVDGIQLACEAAGWTEVER